MKRTSDKSSALTPLMRQYYAVKEKHPDKILFFRMGDFYEMFGDDAVRAAPILGIALTSRSHGTGESVPLAGVPHHSADKYLARLLASGEKVVVVEQVEDPKTAKGIVKREIVEILTPGTATVEAGLYEAKSLCLASIFESGRNRMGMASLDLSTGAFIVYEGMTNEVLERLRVMEPSEVLYPADRERDEIAQMVGLGNGTQRLTSFGEWNFDFGAAERDLNQHFGTATLEGFGVRDQRLAVSAAGAILRYLKENHRDRLTHVDKLSTFDDSEYMVLDFSTVRNLELLRNLSSSSEENSLFSVVNRCQTAAGARRLKNALIRPFRGVSKIELRLSGVTELVKNRELAYQLRRHTRILPDLERLSGRLGIGKLNPRQMKSIADALIIALEIKSLLRAAVSPLLKTLSDQLPELTVVIEKLSTALTDEPPLAVNKGDIFKRGYSTQLDELNDSIRDARQYIGNLQKVERERTGINNLKVGFNKVFGYYIEVTKANLSSVPEDYIRKQTLVSAERYITPALKEKEELILNAEEKIFKLESELYLELMEFVGNYIGDLKLCADLLAEIDLVSGLSEVAVEKGYCRPDIVEDTGLHVLNGRHPVIESVLPPGSFVANDLHLTADDDLIHILTGPNMSGKSTYLRQIGLIVILAQAGSYVPADKAEIGLIDRVFTRVGALDNLARGQSTFLVEMIETANILNNATSRSLVLLDEVGRGTSTFDGLSVAWAVVEHINEKSKSLTIFATHYHELTGLAEIYDKVHNFQVAVKKWENKVIFLHQIIPGGCDDSYGIEVAKLAGLPRSALTRARQILRLLESGKFTQSELGKSIYRDKVQPNLFDAPRSEVEKRVREMDLDQLTPIEALNLLRDLKESLE
ncbi:MAG: DNA mismatch repair protein MutS [Candidatus Zixiibacteriota bacterium]|nr:MAG: DNA mismatch repair protein MutS [candidate division Zixibacteria bacterium]